MKSGDLVRVDFKGKHDGEMEWRPRYFGVFMGEARGSNRLYKRWKILVADSDGEGIGTFANDFWKVTLIQ